MVTKINGVKIARKDKGGFNIPESFDKPAKRKNARLGNDEKQGIGNMVIKQLKEGWPSLTAADRTKVLATTYVLALKEKKDVQI